MISNLTAKNAKPREKVYMLHDDRGLYLRVDPTGRKYWILRYWEEGREHRLSLGPYPVISLQEAREKRNAIQNARARGESPNQNRTLTPVRFEEVASEWLRIRMKGKAEGYLRTIHLRLVKYILPALKARPIEEITSGEVLRLCRHIEGSGHIETARRVKIIVGQVFRFAIASGYAEVDPTAALEGALTPRVTRHMAALTKPEDIRRLLISMRTYQGSLIVRGSLWLSLYTLARPGEVRRAEWEEIDLYRAIWEIPAEKMKKRRPHAIPLSRQCVQVLYELKPYTGTERYIFPSARNDHRPMSENAARVALRTMGFTNEEMTPHGFRSMGSTRLNAMGFRPDVIEAALAHTQPGVRGVYNRGDYWGERVELMQAWADWLESLC